MLRCPEFLVDRIVHDSQPIHKLFLDNGFEKQFKEIKTLDDYYSCGDDFVNSTIDIILNFLSDIMESTHRSEDDEWFGNGDESIYRNGEYAWKYHEFEGWFYYISPEGEHNGLHRNGDSVSV